MVLLKYNFSIALILLWSINLVPVYSFIFINEPVTKCYRHRTESVTEPSIRLQLQRLDSSYCEFKSSIDRRRLIIGNIPKLLVLTALTMEPFCIQPSVANAAFGDSTKIELPSYIDFLIEKNQQVDPTKILYQGVDQEVQLQRILTAVSQIKTIPDIVERKKWSEVQGVITGPLGTLIATMNQVGTTNKQAQQITVKVKADLLAIGQCATIKNEKACIEATNATLIDLNDFVKVAFQ
jgi:hypothetical protein